MRPTTSTPSPSGSSSELVQIPLSAPPEACPQCEADLTPYQRVGQEELSFCLKCKFPLMLVAGKYRLTGILGQGGYSIVYHALHIGMRHSPERVVKVIKPELLLIPLDSDGSEEIQRLSDKEKQYSMQMMRKRFRREVQLTAALSLMNHHIVRIYDDYGEIPNLGYFYVMEFLPGRPLGDYLRDPDNLPPISWTLDVFGQLCEAMQEAHEESIVHRDLKPDNLILVKRRNFPHFLKVIDFGIARSLNSDATPAGAKTRGAVGSPYYMSPEQCTRRPPDARSDIYAMGVLLFQMLTGHHPFIEPGQKEDISIMELLYAHLSSKPPSLREIRPDRNIPPSIEEIVLKALSKKPEERFQSAEEMWEILSKAWVDELEMRGGDEIDLPDTKEWSPLPLVPQRFYPLESSRRKDPDELSQSLSWDDLPCSTEHEQYEGLPQTGVHRTEELIGAFSPVRLGQWLILGLLLLSLAGGGWYALRSPASVGKTKQQRPVDPLRPLVRPQVSRPSPADIAPLPAAKKATSPRAKARPRRRGKAAPCSSKGWVFLRFRPLLQAKAEVSVKGGRFRRVSGGLCVAPSATGVSIDQTRYAPCAFPLPKGKKKLQVCLIEEGRREILTERYCLHAKSCP